jgi:adenylate cyclase
MTIQPLFTRLATFGVEPTDSAELRVRKAILSVAGALTCFSFATTFGPLYLYFDEPAAAIMYLGYAGMGLINLLLYGFGHKNYAWCVLVFAVTALPAHWLTAILLGGFWNSHGVMFWGLFFPVLGSLVFFNARHAIFWFLIYGICLVGILFLQPLLRPANQVPFLVGQTLLALNILISSALSLGIMVYFVSQRDRALHLLHSEQEKSENLLLNILPADIATILKEENRTIADQYDGASVLFADMVGFTPLSAQLAPAEVVELLNEAFCFFDSLLDKYNVEKIRTIGDNYMVASGVPRRRLDHAQALVRMALEMRDYIAIHTFLHGQRVNFRFGINSGPMIGGVIGQRKFVYDVWGDTVNIASRMESHGKANIIQITQTTYDLIKDDFDCEPQGKINVKGKGEMDVWYVVGATIPA